jgi:hypothetical protein
MMQIKTAELTCLALDWALAVALELEPEISRPSPYDGSIAVLALPLPNGYPNHHKCGFFYTGHATCMGLIKEYCIQLFPFCDGEIVRWDADIRPDIRIVNCDTPEQAVARCVVQMRLGDEVDVPDELGVQS